MHKLGISAIRDWRSLLVYAALTAGLLGSIALFIWAMVNPLKLAPNAIYAIIGADYLIGLSLLVGLLVKVSTGQPLDAPTTTRQVQWESDFQSWNTSLGVRLLATEKQLLVLRRLFDLGNCIDNSVSPPRLDAIKRRALLDMIQPSESSPQLRDSGIETQVLFSALQFSDRHHVSAILRGLSQLGDPTLVPRIYSAPAKAGADGGSGLHFEEIRCTAPQCVNVLSALSILQADQDTLLRASSPTSATENAVLLRPAQEAKTAEEELLRSVE